MTQEDKKQLRDWLIDNIHIQESKVDLIVKHVEHYFLQSSPPQRTAEEWGTQGFLDVLKRHCDEKMKVPFPFNWKMLEAAVIEYASQFYTPAQVKQMVGDAWDAAANREHAGHFGKAPNPYPDRTTFINNLKLK